MTFNIYVFQFHETMEEFTESVFCASGLSLSLIKLAILFKTRETVLKTKEMFLSKICQPCDEIEMLIMRTYSHIGR